MNAEARIAESAEGVPPKTGLVRTAFSGLEAFAERMKTLESVVDDLGAAEGDTTQLATRKLKRQIREFEPTVTMIGQVKAGKTTLVNAMVGWPDLLPADINPWTSVVTSLHLDPASRTAAKKARFRFFDEEEWGRLLNRGGRIGELASRAGAHKELEKVRRQLEAMREKSRKRLGRKFELLMGQEHEYGFFDEELVQRYVCLGDDLGEGNDQQGRFADITKSADLFLNQGEMPHKLCVRDTPGVNDTFMIREQITVNAIRESRLCVVVLSAHQTLSTVDMALIRLISNIRSREVIIFVNRIDELGAPVKECEEIRQSIVSTLKALNGPEDAQIIFGSAYWASQALGRGFGNLNSASGRALVEWAEHHISADSAPGSVEETIWRLSGIPALCDAISSRIAAGEGAEFEERVVRSARNIANGLAAERDVVARRIAGGEIRQVARADVGREIDAIAERSAQRLEAKLRALTNDLDHRLAGSRQSFVSRATASLIKHLEMYGDHEVWSYDPSGLRLLLRSGYRVFTTKAQKSCEEVFADAAKEIRELYIGAFGLTEGAVDIAAPAVPKPPPPVILGSTIALDVKGNWWTNWWRRRRGYQAFADEFSKLIEAETEPFLASLRADHADPFAASVRNLLTEFVEGRRAHLLELADRTEAEIGQMTAGGASDERWDRIESTISFLSEYQVDGERSAAQ